MQEPIITTLNNSANLDFSVDSGSPTGLALAMPTVSLDLDFDSAESILKHAEVSFEKRDFKTTTKLVERALPAIDRLYSNDEVRKIRALKMLRDSYLALGKGNEAKDCAEVGLAVFEEIMKNKVCTEGSLEIGDPGLFARPVVRRLKTLRRGKDSEYLRKRSADLTEKWRLFCKSLIKDD